MVAEGVLVAYPLAPGNFCAGDIKSAGLVRMPLGG
jgi:hypothetical protein